MKIGIAAIILLALARPTLAQNARKNIVLDRSASDQANSPWSDAVLVGNTLYLSGYVGADPKTLAVPASAEEETRLAMDDIQHTLKAAGMTMDDLVVVHVLCTDLSLFQKFNTAYKAYFHGGFPARSFTGASTLLLGAHFEITGIAIKRVK